jgi:DNA-binding NarL/FixJ family response regulator
METLRVLIVGDDPLTRAGLTALLSAESDIQINGEFEAGADWVDQLNAFDPDAIVWDLGWDSAVEIEGVLDLASEMPPILALVPDETQIYRLWVSGIRGLLARNAGAEALASAIRSLKQGLAVFDPSLLRSLVAAEDAEGGESESALSPREMDVLRLLADGLSNRAIAEELVISEHTVKFHVNSIMGKLNAESRTEAVVIAMRAGIISL